MGQPITYESGGTTLKGYIAYDDSTNDPRPGVLVVHEWWGHNEYTRSRARQLAGLGYTALAVDMYGDGKQADNPADAGKLMEQALSDPDAAVARFEAARQLLAADPRTNADKIAAIGYCFGGGVVLHAARIGMDLAGVASFHGSLAPMAEPKKGQVKAKILVCHGAADALIPAEQVDALEREMEAAGADLKLVAHPGAMHGFTNPAATEKGQKFDLPLAYDKAADEASWAELTAFLASIF